MSFENNDVIVKFGAHTSELETGSQKAGQIIDNLKGGFEGLGSVIEHLGGAFTGFAAILAGGAIFAEGIKAATEEAAEVRGLMNGLGMTAEAASKMKIALELVGVSAEEYVGIAMKFDRQLRTNEDGLKKLGVVTRDQSGNLLAQDVLLKNAVNTMMEYKAGTDRNAVSMAMFGRDAAGAFKLLKLNDDVKQRASELAEKIGEIMTPEELENVKQYKMEMAATKVVVDAFSENLGGAVMPGLTKMAQAFLEIGTSIMPMIKGAFEVSGVAFDGLGEIIKTTVNRIVGLFSDLANKSAEVFRGQLPDDVMTWAHSMAVWSSVSNGAVLTVIETINLLTWAIKQAGNAWDGFFSGVTEVLSGKPIAEVLKGQNKSMGATDNEYYENQKRAQEEYLKSLKRTWDAYAADRKRQQDSANNSGKSYEGQDKKTKSGDDSKIPGWTEKLNVQRALEIQQQGHEMSLAEERAYWENVLATQAMSAKDRQKIELAVSHIKLQILQQDLRNRRALTDEEINMQEAAAKDSVAIEQDRIKTKLDLGLISQQQYNEQLTNAENAQFEIAQAAQEKRIELAKQDPNNPLKAQQEYDKLLQIIRTHNQTVGKLTDNVVKESAKKWQDLFKGISDGFGKALGGFLVGTQTWQKSLQGIYQSIQQSFANMISGMVSKWIEGEITKLAVSMGIIGQKKTAETVSDATTIASKKAVAVATIPAEAATAAGGAASAVAAIPVVGPELAASAYAATMAMVMSGLGVASASGGYDIPAGINPLTQLHQREMVLPANLADTVRGMAASGGAKQGGDVHLHVAALDGQSVKRLFEREGGAIAESLKKQMRNFKS